MPSSDFSREVAEAERMIREMRDRSFGNHLREAETEKREAQLCKDDPKLTGFKYNAQSTISSPVPGGRCCHFSGCGC